MPEFAPLTLGRWRYAGAGAMPRHRHCTGYVALVLSGSYEEVGDCGRFQVNAGDVLFHRRFEAHLDRFAPTGADTLNFDLGAAANTTLAFGRARDPDRIVRLAERDPHEARDTLLGSLVPQEIGTPDWPDMLAADIRREPSLNLTAWAEANGLAPATVSRGFQRVYGIPPVAFRAQMRTQHAWHAIVESDTSLAMIAADVGFADQAHMTRNVSALTGATPSAWRNNVK
jgi:AraC-like DNA-binding protein